MPNLPIYNRQSGQTLIVILLVVAVSLLAGMSATNLSTSTVQQTTFSEEATQALAAAESCAEIALGKIKLGATDPVNGLVQSDLPCDGIAACHSFTDPPPKCAGETIAVGSATAHCCYTVTEMTEVFPNVIAQDETAEVKLEGSSGSLNIYWCDTASAAEDCGVKRPALEGYFILDNGTTEKFGYHENTTWIGFDLPGPAGPAQGRNFAYSVRNVSVPTGAQALRLTPRFGDASIAVVGPGLPLQGFIVVSEGFFGRSTRKVKVTKTMPSMPAIFDYAIFSGASTPLDKD